jgi:hypothetical protein
MYASDGSQFFNVEAMSRYIPGVNMTTLEVGNIWWCPSARTDFQRKAVQTAVQQEGYFLPSYSYFGGVDKWTPESATQPDDLTGNELRAGKLLMTDSLFYWHVTSAWFYNHGRRGSAYHHPDDPAPKDYGPPAFTGLNELFGDASVSWKSSKKFDVPNLKPTTPNIGMVRGTYGDTSFY